MALLVPAKPTLTGTLAAPVAAAVGGDTLPNPRGKAALRVINGAGAPINVTINAPTPAPVRGADGVFPAQTLTNLVIAVANATTRVIGPIPPCFNDGSGNVSITYSSVTTITVDPLDLDV